MSFWLKSVEKYPKTGCLVASLFFMLVVGVVDLVTGYELSFSVFYLLGVSVTAWYVGQYWAMIQAGLSVAIWLGGDMAMGAHYTSEFVPVWNAAIMLALYLIVVCLIGILRDFSTGLEKKVEERTADLKEEIGRREQLERELLAVSEREKQQLGYDLHDGLGQHFTGTAMAGEVLREKLAARGLQEADDAGRLVALAEEGVNLSRRLAKGLRPVEMDADGLMHALEELAASSSELYRISCRFESDLPVLIRDTAVAGHLYRIIQDAVGNAVRQAGAQNILIRFEAGEDSLALTLWHDGATAVPDGDASMQIMAHRAGLIGASLSVRRPEVGGTLVACTLPAPARQTFL
jgi:signal transduction histidine kinase